MEGLGQFKRWGKDGRLSQFNKKVHFFFLNQHKLKEESEVKRKAAMERNSNYKFQLMGIKGRIIGLLPS